MSEAVLIFTFSPIQSFITEARRTADLFVASQILVKLAQSAGEALKQYGTLVYPEAIEEDDVPNKIMVLLPWEKAQIAAEDGKKALLREWENIAGMAKDELKKIKPFPDDTWDKIWQRQTANLWEVYWSAANLDGRTYAEGYKEAERALAGAKRFRTFEAADEYELKDSLSGRREALHTASFNAKEYWTQIYNDIAAAKKLHPEGRERLDAIGATKRFCKLARNNFPSTSTIASTDFLNKARPYLADYRQVVEKQLGNHLYFVRQDNDWPYDGDLLFIETLTQHRLENSYGVKGLSSVQLQEAQEKLHEVYKTAKSKPSPYYALIVLDGDDMGKKIDECLKLENPQESHRNFSIKLREFSSKVPDIIKNHSSRVVYNGGDDVVALAPLMQAFPLVQLLSNKFAEATTGCTASVGIAIVHHLYPLGKAVQAARDAEREAKQVPDKASVCVKVLKRSGTTLTVRSRWQDFNSYFSKVTEFFKKDKDDQESPLAGKFAYDIVQSAITFPASDEMFKAELTRLLKRHRNKEHPMAPNPQEWGEKLQVWSANLPEAYKELGNWLILARFIAKGGSE